MVNTYNPERLSPLSDISADFLNNLSQIQSNPEYTFLSTGYKSINNKLIGFFRTGLYILGARPGMGKTSLACNIMVNIAKNSNSVLFCSLEIAEAEVIAKIYSIYTGISYKKILMMDLSENEIIQIKKITPKIEKLPIYIYSGRLTIADIDNIAKEIKNLSLIIIDYLGLISPNKEDINRPRYEQMAITSASLKELSKRHRLPVVAIAQLNRENALSSTNDHRPQLHNLRDSGTIEQDADGVILLHRPEYFNTKLADQGYKNPEYEKAELIIAKNRHGEIGTVEMAWHGSTGEFLEIIN